MGELTPLARVAGMTEPHRPAPPSVPEAAPVRTCIASGAQDAPERMIRFVVGPEGNVVPDLARRLPGRGMWLTAERASVEQAMAKKLFARAARRAVTVDPDLPQRRVAHDDCHIPVDRVRNLKNVNRR